MTMMRQGSHTGDNRSACRFWHFPLRLMLSTLTLLIPAVTLESATLASTAHAAAMPGPVEFFEADLLHTDHDGRKSLSISDSHGILDAMEAGNTTRLLQIQKELQQNPGPEPGFNIMRLALCDAAIARTRGDMAHSDQIIQEALLSAEPWSNPLRSINPFNFLLLALLDGNALIEGRSSEWARGQAFLEHFFLAPIRAHYEISGLIFSDLDQVQLTASPETIPPLESRGARTNHVAFNPFATIIDGFTTTTAATKIDLDGTITPAIINTGTLIGAVPAALQRKYHWPKIGIFGADKDGAAQPEKLMLVRVPSLTLGDTVIRNQIMLVIQSNYAVIGLQTLGLLRHVVMTDRDMTFGPDAPFACHRQAPQQSDVAGVEAALLLPVSYGGRKSMARIMTGENDPEPLVINVAQLAPSLIGERKQQDINTPWGTKQERVVLHPAALRIDGRLVHDRIRYRIGNPDLLPILTISALQGVKLSFDLREGVACLD